MHNDRPKAEEVGPFQLVVLILSLVVVAAFLVNSAFHLPLPVSRLLGWMDTAVCLVLLFDVGMRFCQAESKLVFMKWGTVDLLASIPHLPVLRVGRLIRVLRIIRLIRAVRSTHKITAILLRDKLESGVASVLVAVFLLVTASSIGILILEQNAPNAKIKTGPDALWWSVATLTTAGGGDLAPVTPEGRALALGLMICGAGLVGALSGLVASALIGQRKPAPDDHPHLAEQLKRIEDKLDRLNKP
jgi:voltage-gated potassium channel